MKILLLLTILSASLNSQGQIDTLKQRMVPMSSTIEKPYKVGSVYYKSNEKTPYTGVLYGKYNNGNYLTLQEYKNGIGNGKWVNYYKDGTIMEIGNYHNNRVEGSIKQYHENGKLKAEGTYKHWKKKVGIWIYYDTNGNTIRKINYSQ